MNKKLRIAMVGAYPTDVTRMNGGVQAAYAYLVKGLAQRDDLELHVLLNRSKDGPEDDLVNQKNVAFHFLTNHPRYERLRNYRAFQTIVNEVLAGIQPDLIHAQDAGAEALVALRSGIPTVVTVHGIRWEDGKHYSSLMGRLRVIYDSMITEQYVVRHARHLIAISPYVTRYFKRLLRPDVKIYDLPNAIDERYFGIDTRKGSPVILFAGRVIPRKRVLDLARAFARVLVQVPSARLHIAGEVRSEPGYAEAIRSFIHASNLDEQISFLGALSEEAILHEFCGCRVLALPSAQETAPMVIAQAMAAGKPVVAANVGGVKEMLGEDSGRGLLVEVGDIDGLSSALTSLLDDGELCDKMGQAGRLFAQEQYRMENVACRTAAVYYRVAGRENPFND